MPLTSDRDTKESDGRRVPAGLAAATKIFGGSLVALNAAGYAVPGSASTTLKSAGRADSAVDNSTGAAGDKQVVIEKGTFLFNNSTSTDLITIADRGNDCYIVDDQTVAKTNGTNTRSIAGKIHDVTSQGVWVKFA
ncbi:MAG: hypothetical protein DI551_08240 [Micavibrio aeruginosavorus]|uniref:Bacteriophage protein n=1 Tax=Micavibrio aeruginosavorus TaxID=349221 RepID=A0A2W5PKQ0_9BACT|nr:MAG: hypothetical protein DI551_08240 [Micavibrio aeruginosavorus]